MSSNSATHRRDSDGKNRFDKALIEAMKRKRDVDLYLAVELPWVDGDGYTTVKILAVDTYAIQIRHVETGQVSWIGKAFLVDTRILPAYR